MKDVDLKVDVMIMPMCFTVMSVSPHLFPTSRCLWAMVIHVVASKWELSICAKKHCTDVFDGCVANSHASKTACSLFFFFTCNYLLLISPPFNTLLPDVSSQ